MSQRLAFAAAVVALSVGCGRVVLQDDSDVESSSSGPAVVAVSTGGGAVTSGSAGGDGAGGAPSLPGGEGGGGEDAVPRCGELTWGEVAFGESETWTNERTLLEVVPSHGVNALFFGRKGCTFEGCGSAPSDYDSRVAQVRFVPDPWDGTASFDDQCGPRDDSCQRSEDARWYPATATHGGMRFLWQCPRDDPDDNRLEDVILITEGGGSGHSPVDPSSLGVDPVRDLAEFSLGSGEGMTTATAYAGGRQRLALTTLGLGRSEKVGYQPVAVDACADRELALDVVGHGEGFAIAYASSADTSTCDGPGAGAPTIARVGLFSPGGAVVDIAHVDFGLPITELHLVRDTGSWWMVARVDGEATGHVVSIAENGRVHRRTTFDLRADRALGVSAWGKRLLLVDSGPGGAWSSASIHVRVLEENGALEVDSPPPPVVFDPQAAVGVLGSPDHMSIAVAFADRVDEHTIRHVVTRLDCSGP